MTEHVTHDHATEPEAESVVLANLRIPYTATHDAPDGCWYKVAGNIVCAECNGTGHDDCTEDGQCAYCWEVGGIDHEGPGLVAILIELRECEVCMTEVPVDQGWVAGNHRHWDFECDGCFQYHDLRARLHSELWGLGVVDHDVVHTIVRLVRDQGWVVKPKEAA